MFDSKCKCENFYIYFVPMMFCLNGDMLASGCGP